jgi:ferredoxin
MAKIISETLDKELDVPDGSDLDVIKDGFDVPFGCEDGICGTCTIEVLEGMENITERNQKEIDFALKDPDRLACQCKIKSGTIKVKHY